MSLAKNQFALFTSVIITAVTCLGLFGCSSSATETTKKSINPNSIKDLQVVDCLLPGQTRILGQQAYVTPRRPAMLTAADCRIRGGEYVDYDRADYKTALKVWMVSAESGDSEAQTNVGEIFERGLGGEPNYTAAIIWYKKAAQQGNRRALFNLGTLYEQGQGVPADKLIAMNYYRQAWDMPKDSLIFQSAVDTEREVLKKQLNTKINKKNIQISVLQRQMNSLDKELEKSKKNQELIDQLNGLKGLVADLESANQNNIQQLAAYKSEDRKRKLRSPTVITKTHKTFDKEAQALIQKDINFGKYYALVIGIENYNNMSNLDTPINDIESISTLLETQYGFTVEKVVNADNISIMEAINNLNQRLSEEDNLLIFYAGHGYRLQNKHIQSGYWLPTNADAPPRDTNWVSNEFITRHLARLEAKRILIVADSCYAGLLSKSPDFLLAGNNSNDIGFIKYKINKRSRLLLTSGGDQPVLDSTGDKHSIFAQAFIDTLKNNDEIMTGPQLFKSVHDKVVKESANTQFRQEPEYKAIKGAGHEIGEFFFIPQKGKNVKSVEI